MSAPAGLVATIGLTEVNPGATSRFTSRPDNSATGASYSHRAPALTVSTGFTRQSSVTYAS